MRRRMTDSLRVRSALNFFFGSKPKEAQTKVGHIRRSPSSGITDVEHRAFGSAPTVDGRKGYATDPDGMEASAP